MPLLTKPHPNDQKPIVFTIFFLALIFFIGLCLVPLVKKFGVDPSVLTTVTAEEKRLAEEALSIFHPASQRLPGILNDEKATISDKQYDLHTINIPTLILHDVGDLLVDFDLAKYAHAHSPHSELIPFQKGGHMRLGQSEKYREVVASFLKEHM